MSWNLVLGLTSLAISAVLFFVALPRSGEDCARFLRFHVAITFYPAIVLVFFAFGMAQLVSWYLMLT